MLLYQLEEQYVMKMMINGVNKFLGLVLAFPCVFLSDSPKLLRFYFSKLYDTKISLNNLTNNKHENGYEQSRIIITKTALDLYDRI